MPDDSTPLGDAMTHRFNEQKMPQSKHEGEHEREREQARPDISQRPSSPDHRQPPAADRSPPSKQRG